MFWQSFAVIVGQVIRIWMEKNPPPTGRIVIDEEAAAVPFAGWLELLGILSGVMDPSDGAARAPVELLESAAASAPEAPDAPSHPSPLEPS